MHSILEQLFVLTVSNVILAGIMAILIFLLTRVWRNPHFAHALWLLVLLINLANLSPTQLSEVVSWIRDSSF